MKSIFGGISIILYAILIDIYLILPDCATLYLTIIAQPLISTEKCNAAG